jgi:hypothetical protein
MTQHVSLDFVEINKRHFNLSFIIVKNRGNNDPWSNFFRRTPWTSNVPTPKSFYTLDLGVYGRHIFHPCAPFQLAKDDCSTWLEWEIVLPPNKDEDEIKMLHFIHDPAETLADEKTKTGISAHPNFTQWADQLVNGPTPVLGNLNRMEEIVKSTINMGLRSIPNQVANKLRQDIREAKQTDSWRDGRQQRSRSPDPRRYSRSPERRRSPRRPRSPQQYGTQSVQPSFIAHQPQQLLPPPTVQQPLYAPQQQLVTQQHHAQQQQLPPQQQQLPPQQQLWNNGIQNMMSNQPQPGLMYAPQRMNAP